MGELPIDAEQSKPISTLRMFWIGGAIMFPWPILGMILRQVDFPITNIFFFVGTFVLLFTESLDRIEQWSSKLPWIWNEVVMWTVFILMVAMWVIMWFLPFFGVWRRHAGVLYFAQFSYAGAQAICGWVFIGQHI